MVFNTKKKKNSSSGPPSRPPPPPATDMDALPSSPSQQSGQMIETEEDVPSWRRPGSFRSRQAGKDYANPTTKFRILIHIFYCCCPTSISQCCQWQWSIEPHSGQIGARRIKPVHLSAFNPCSGRHVFFLIRHPSIIFYHFVQSRLNRLIHLFVHLRLVYRYGSHTEESPQFRVRWTVRFWGVFDLFFKDLFFLFQPCTYKIPALNYLKTIWLT